MKVIIAGSRSLWKIKNITQRVEIIIDNLILEDKIQITQVVSGHNLRSIDACGEKYARNRNLDLRIFPANWRRFKNAAGILRNAEMANYADVLIAIWDGSSRGTLDMILKMRELGKPTHVKVI